MRRKLLAWVLLAAAAQVHAQIEKRDVHIAVGGKTALYYLPLTLTERLGHFKDEGLNLRISDFPGGTRSLEAGLRGRPDDLPGRHQHNNKMQGAREEIPGVRVYGGAPQDAVGEPHK